MLRSFVVSALIMGVLGIVFAPSASANPCSGRGAEATYASFGCYYPSPWSTAVTQRNPVRHHFAAKEPHMKLSTIKKESKKLVDAACNYKGNLQVNRGGGNIISIFVDGAANQCVKGSKSVGNCVKADHVDFMGWCAVSFMIRDPFADIHHSIIACTSKSNVWYDYAYVDKKVSNVKLYSLLTNGYCWFWDPTIA